MSIDSLRAERNRLERELRDIQSENYQLQSEVNRTVGQINQLHSELESYQRSINQTLTDSARKMNNSVSMSEQAIGLQQQIEELYPLYMNIEAADKSNRQLQQKIYYDFKTYRTVRKIMQGIMDNIDLSLVSEDVIYKAVEKQHLQTPDFWLTSAMLSIMGWKTDRKEFSERTIESSFKLDAKNTCVFFMIFNLRMGREEAALKWLFVYEQQGIKGSDYETFLMMFSLISKTVYENVSTKTRTRLESFVNRIVKESMERSNFSNVAVLSMICDYLTRTKTKQSFDCPAIRKYSDAYEYLTETLSLAQNNENILDWISSVANPRTSERNAYLKHYMDILIATPNEIEKSTYDEMLRNDLIIEKYGRKDEAEIAFSEEMSRRARDINLIVEMTNTIHDETNVEVNAQMRKNMFVILKEFERNGYVSYLNNYRSRNRSVFNVKIQDYSTEADFRDLQGENKKIDRFYDTWLTNQLSNIKDTASFIMFGCGVAAFIASFFIKQIVLGAFVLVLLGLIGGIKMLVNKSTRSHLADTANVNSTSTKDIMRQIVNEYSNVITLIKKYDDINESILDEFAQI